MKLPALIVTVIVIVSGTGLWISAANSQDDALASRKSKREESARKVKELQTERLTALKDLAEVMHALYRKVRVDADRVYDAQQLLLRAQVELAEDDSDRIKLYEKFVDVMKDYEEIAVTRKQAAQGTQLEVLKAKAIRLEAEIALEKVRSGTTSK